jgi:hypothetical protein
MNLKHFSVFRLRCFSIFSRAKNGILHKVLNETTVSEPKSDGRKRFKTSDYLRIVTMAIMVAVTVVTVVVVTVVTMTAVGGDGDDNGDMIYIPRAISSGIQLALDGAEARNTP